MADAQGVDVSNFQPSFDWQAEKGRISFAFIKATEGTTFTDPDFGTNWRQSGAIGLVRGAYHFGHPGNPAAAEVSAFLAVVRAQGLHSGDLLALDLETTDGLQPAQVASYAQAWCDGVARATGHTPVVYTFLSFAQQGNCAGLGKYPLWIAEPSAPAGRPSVPGPWTTWHFHQYGTTRVGSNTVDADVFNGDTAALHAFANPAPAPQEDDVQSGTLNNGADAVTAISIPEGSARTIGFGCDNGLQGLAPARLRVAIWHGSWEIHDPVVVDSTKGQTVIGFADPSTTTVISVQRLDAGEVNVGYQVS
ncbi:MAG: glycoside hydrolase family 25 protein [Streptosporangiales bacterium]